MKYIPFFFLALIMSGCISITSLQSGRTVGKGNVEVAASATYGNYSKYSIDWEEYNNLPIAEVGGNFGLNDNLDIGLNINSIFTISSNLKCQFIGNKSSLFASSLGTEAGISFLMIGNSVLYYYYSIPLYLSYHPSENISLFITPRYGKSFIESPGSDNYPDFQSIKTNHFGFSYGFSFGNKNKIVLELSNFNKTKLYIPTHISLGYVYTFRFIYD